MRIQALLLFTATLGAGSCSKPATKSEPAPLAATGADSVEMLRQSAAELLAANCGECHTSGLPTALPRALAVYDLTQLDWSRSMSDAQLREADRRLREPFAPTRGEAEVRPVRASQPELDRFHHYVELETARRAAVP
jgi:hypothetical protein